MYMHVNNVVDYKEKIDFKGQLLVEPKAKEPTRHQYDYGMFSIIVDCSRRDVQCCVLIFVYASVCGRTYLCLF